MGKPISTTLSAQVGGSESHILVLHLVWSPVPCTGSVSNGGHKRASPISEGNESGSDSSPTTLAVSLPPPSKNMQNQPDINLLQLICPEELTMPVSTDSARRNIDHLPKFEITYRLGSGESFHFWFEDWSGQGSMRLIFPRPFTLARDQQGPICQAWQEAWAPALPVALSDQRAADLLRLQELLGDCQPSEGPDAWL